MKILMILDHDFPPDVRVEKEIKTLINNGHSIVLACFNYKKNQDNLERHDSLTIYRKKISKQYHKTSVGALKFPFYFNFWRRFIKLVLKKEKIDAVHVHDLPLAKVGLEIKSKYNIPFILDLHENWPALLETAVHTNTFLGKLLSSNKQWQKYEAEMANNANCLITVVEEMKERIEKLNVDSKKIKVVANTININELAVSDVNIDDKYTTLFYAGGINIHRGVHIVLQSINLIKNDFPNLRFKIIGDGSYLNRLKDLVDDLAINDYVQFLGYMPQDEVIRQLFMCDIALIPHLRSVQTDCSSPNKLYQYMFAQKPIVASNCISVERVIKETNSGITYVYNNPQDLASKLQVLLRKKPEELKEMGINGYNAVKEKYNWNIDSKELIKIYRNL